MVYFLDLSITPDEIVCFLQRDMQLKRVCQKILEEKIITQAAKARGLIVTAKEIQAETERLYRENNPNLTVDRVTWITEQMITPEDWEAGIRNRLLAKKLAESLFDQDIKNFFTQNKLDFEQVLLYQIVVPYQKLAQELFYQIEESEINFFQAAHLYDIDERRRHYCGYEGKLYRWNLKPNIADAVFNANLGELIGPITTEQGSHILIVEEFIPAELNYESYREHLARLFKQWLDSEQNRIFRDNNIKNNLV